jgi:predicted permease
MSPLTILTTILLPIFILIAIGAVLDRGLHLDVQTLARFNFYALSPAVIFLAILDSTLDGRQILTIVAFTVVHGVLLTALALAVFSRPRFAGRRAILISGTLFTNAGNYGFPLMLLAFGEWAIGVIVMLLLTQLVVMFTVGVAMFVGERESPWRSARRLLEMPTLWAIVLGFAVRALGVTLPEQIMLPLEQLNNAFIAVALVTLGAQLSRGRFGGDVIPAAALTGIRLVAAPLLALALLPLFNFSPETARVLAVASGLPMAVNVFILAVEFDQDADFASQMVFWTTLLSAVTIPVLLWAVH